MGGIGRRIRGGSLLSLVDWVLGGVKKLSVIASVLDFRFCSKVFFNRVCSVSVEGNQTSQGVKKPSEVSSFGSRVPDDRLDRSRDYQPRCQYK